VSESLEGEKELLKKFAKLSADSRVEIRKKALLAGGQVFATAWKGNINKEHHNFLTGTYRRSIQYTYDKFIVLIGTNIIKPPYPWWLETGTSKMAARPAMMPAFESSKDDIVKAIIKVIRILVRKSV
jgi:HK97 gp10 family phage protein